MLVSDTTTYLILNFDVTKVSEIELRMQVPNTERLILGEPTTSKKQRPPLGGRFTNQAI